VHPRTGRPAGARRPWCCCTTLLADYFHGPRRERCFGLQVVCTALAATVFLAVGGALGAQDRRAPFWLYAVSLPLAVLAPQWLWQPAEAAREPGALPRLPRPRLAGPVAVTLLGGLVFYVLTVALAFALSGAGLVALALTTTLPLVVAAAVVTGTGNGLLLPALLTRALGGLEFAQRGRATGVRTSALFLGQFACPPVVIALGGVLGGLTGALVALGVVALVAAAAVRLARR
jgi:hypothetical protein